MPKLDEEKLAELKKKHVEVYVVSLGEHDYAFRPATAPEYDRAASAEGAMQKKAVARLAYDTLVFPSLDAFNAIVDGGASQGPRPGVPLRIGMEVMKVANELETDLARKA
jgi:hypothetical protein